MYNNRSSRWQPQRGENPVPWFGPLGGADRRNLLAPGDRRSVPPRRFTLHLGFEAGNLEQAREWAVGYAEALSLIRPEIAFGSAALSSADGWQRAQQLFCLAVGPEGEQCADVFGHPGFHHGLGPGALGWGDGDR